MHFVTLIKIFIFWIGLFLLAIVITTQSILKREEVLALQT